MNKDVYLNMNGYDVVEHLPFCAFIVNDIGEILWVNTAGFAFFVSQQVIGLNVFKLVKGKIAFKDSLDSVLATGNAVCLSKVEVNVEGVGAKLLDMTLSQIRAGVLFCVTKDYDGDGDVHSGVSKIVSLLAHEIKNPLSGIRGASQLLGDSLAGLQQDNSLATLITEETDRITDLVNSLENLAIDKPITFGAINIHQVLDKVVALGQAGFAEKCNIIKNYDPSLPLAWGQEDMLVQVFINILKNASESFDYKEKNIFNISIKTSFVSGLSIIIDGVRHQAFCVDIIDNGRGISIDRQVDIFTPYVSIKKGGSGLGLSIVSRYVNAHKGRIRLNSDKTGTTFSIILPLEAI